MGRLKYSAKIFDLLRGSFDHDSSDVDGTTGGGINAGTYQEINQTVDDTGDSFILDTRLRPLVWVAVHAVDQNCDITAEESAFPGASLTVDITSNFTNETDGTITAGDTALLRYDPSGGAIDLDVSPSAGGSANIEVVVH